ncbi:probable ubiquitin-conjugating enzyme E2 25 [Papaver somniferum]|uniref:probable ubiquitin-conjugating enzyme E2 25 n=1 Tax=Papaver somniferum TaxID=3469 RepID=UPI000E6F51DB|nr:probable ubiquitin-conjugating enzyme E2 25 [Papaver somniferum]
MVYDFPHDGERVEIKIVDGELNQKQGTVGEAEEEKVNGTTIRNQFKQFDFVSSTAQSEKGIIYHYAPSSSSGKQQINNSSIDRHRRIMQEWKILKTGLPDSVYVRVYDNDVIRAAIIGGAVRCYNECTLLNLHAAGVDRFRIDTRWATYQCQKLLVAKWNPNTSTILDILLSVQLVFQTEDPYYGMKTNDPRLQKAIKTGYKFDESLKCNERLFRANCLAMLVTLRRPPKDFEEFVAQHFRDRAETILTAFNRYKIKYGDHFKYEMKMGREYHDSMVNIYTKLLKAFIKNGSSLDGFVGDINLDDDDSGHVVTSESHISAAITLWILGLLFICMLCGGIWFLIQAIRGNT